MHMLTLVHTCVCILSTKACVKKMDFRIRNEYLYLNGYGEELSGKERPYIASVEKQLRFIRIAEEKNVR